MIATSSAVICALVKAGELDADAAVDQLLDAGDHGGRSDCFVSCPECGADFWRSWPVGRWNTCSDACQIAHNTAIMKLDGGRTIIKVSDLTPERTATMLRDVGLEVCGDSEVMSS